MAKISRTQGAICDTVVLCNGSKQCTLAGIIVLTSVGQSCFVTLHL